jgi:hypothetical protein
MLKGKKNRIIPQLGSTDTHTLFETLDIFKTQKRVRELGPRQSLLYSSDAETALLMFLNQSINMLKDTWLCQDWSQS